VEFVHESEVADLLRENRLKEIGDGPDHVYFEMDGGEDLVHLHLTCPESRAAPRNGAKTVPVDKADLPRIIEHIMHLLHFEQIVLVPVGKWRSIFDAVAFSLAANEDWQAMDATATVELNTRDPLFCEPGDFRTVVALIQALLTDAESTEQGLMVIPTAAPVLIEIVPDGAVRISLGNPVLADELVGALPS
jgi:hypothetical protein